MCISEVQLTVGLGDDNRPAPVGGEVHVVRIKYRYRLARTGGARIDRGEAVTQIVRHIQRTQIPGGSDVLRKRPDWELLGDLERSLRDDVTVFNLLLGT